METVIFWLGPQNKCQYTSAAEYKSKNCTQFHPMFKSLGGQRHSAAVLPWARQNWVTQSEFW